MGCFHAQTMPIVDTSLILPTGVSFDFHMITTCPYVYAWLHGALSSAAGRTSHLYHFQGRHSDAQYADNSIVCGICNGKDGGRGWSGCESMQLAHGVYLTGGGITENGRLSGSGVDRSLKRGMCARKHSRLADLSCFLLTCVA